MPSCSDLMADLDDLTGGAGGDRRTEIWVRHTHARSRSGGEIRGMPSDLLSGAGLESDTATATRGGSPRRRPPGVIVTGTASDAHTWNLVFLQLMLEELGHDVDNLGPCVPDEELLGPSAEQRPRWSSSPASTATATRTACG